MFVMKDDTCIDESVLDKTTYLSDDLIDVTWLKFILKIEYHVIQSVNKRIYNLKR